MLRILLYLCYIDSVMIEVEVKFRIQLGLLIGIILY